MRPFHWLPLAARITFKTLMIAYEAKKTTSPQPPEGRYTRYAAQCSHRASRTAPLNPPSEVQVYANDVFSALVD